MKDFSILARFPFRVSCPMYYIPKTNDIQEQFQKSSVQSKSPNGGPKIPQIRDLPDSGNLDLRNKGGGFLLNIGLIGFWSSEFVCIYDSGNLQFFKVSALKLKVSSRVRSIALIDGVRCGELIWVIGGRTLIIESPILQLLPFEGALIHPTIWKWL